MIGVRDDGAAPEPKGRAEQPHISEDPYKKGETRLLELERSGLPSHRARELAALELLEEVTGAPFRSLMDNTAQIAIRATDLLTKDGSGILYLMGEIVAHSAVQWFPGGGATKSREVRKQALIKLGENMEAAENFLRMDPLLAPFLQEYGAQDRGVFRLYIPSQLENHPLRQEAIAIGVSLLKLVDVVKNKEVIDHFIGEVEELCSDLKKVVNEPGLINFAQGLSSRRVAADLNDIYYQVNVAIGEGLPSELEVFGSSRVLDMFKASMAFTSSRDILELAKLLTVQMPDSSTRIFQVSNEDLALVADLHLSKPKTIRLLREWVSSCSGGSERKESLFWLLENPDSEKFLTDLSRQGLSTEERAEVLGALREDEELLPQLSREVDSPLKMRIFARILRHGETTFLSPRARAEAFRCADMQPQFAAELVGAWLSYAANGEVAKANYVKQLSLGDTLNQQEGARILAAISKIPDDALPDIRPGMTPRAMMKSLEKEAGELSKRQDEVVKYQRGIDPVALEAGRLIQLGQRELGNALERECSQDILLRRGVRVILDNCPEAKLASALEVVLSDHGRENVRKICKFPLLRRKLGKLFEGDPERACHLLQDAKLDENWEQAKLMLLQDRDRKDDSLQRPSKSDQSQVLQEQSSRNAPVVFGQWRGLKRVLIVGGEYTGAHADTITSAVPNVDISILDSKSDSANPHLLDGRFNLYVCVRRSLPHSLERQAKIARDRSGANWHNFNRISAKLLAEELRFGFGILEEE
ncbi:MAG: hypothetical protein KDD70_03150 [Bdellovibrionales bacterium]|nr:hypothetical protein [Bdellovibrionales bacterium]